MDRGDARVSQGRRLASSSSPRTAAGRCVPVEHLEQEVGAKPSQVRQLSLLAVSQRTAF